MGGSCWSVDSYRTYACSTGREYDAATNTIATNYCDSSQAFTSYELNESLDPKGVVRECCDSEEHPDTVPVILALDVTGSMGDTAIKIQKQLNPIMQKLYETVKDVEIAIMAIGDLACDDAPIQLSQFESDIRIADNLDKIYFEGGGGGNSWESYTAAWYVGAWMTKLDCWKRGKKGIIITMGDERINPYLPNNQLSQVVGTQHQYEIETPKLYEEVTKKYDVYHICVQSKCYPEQSEQARSFEKVIGKQNVFISDVDGIQDKIVGIIQDSVRNNTGFVMLDESEKPKMNENGEICW